MSYVTSNQPDGTPTWIDLDVPDLGRATEFYGALLGWDFSVESAGETTGTESAAGAGAGSGGYAMCLLRGRAVAGLRQTPAAGAPTAGTPGHWLMYFATEDCDATAKRVTGAGGTLLQSPQDVGVGRRALAKDPVGARFGLWQGRTHPGCEIVNEPGSLVRNDLTTPDPGPARAFYPAVFDFTLDANDDLPDADFTFLRRPDGHEIGGIMGVPAADVPTADVPTAAASVWQTLFEVADTDATVRRAVAAGGTASAPVDTIYTRMAEITDPFGTTFQVGARPRGGRES
ncbi:VOC family protein [Streptomyces sp. NPDC088116]|uniref:VOC family protein n=1 Tax=Streptomyces sp. NPDC088116 TaxID=3365825 RepID=UPI0038048AE7